MSTIHMGSTTTPSSEYKKATECEQSWVVLVEVKVREMGERCGDTLGREQVV